MLAHSDFEVNLISRKYDISDPNSPLKYHYESVLIPISKEGYSQTFINIIRNDYKINDWYSFFIEGKTKTFYSFEKEEHYLRVQENCKSSVSLTLDNFWNFYIDFYAMIKFNTLEEGKVAILVYIVLELYDELLY